MYLLNAISFYSSKEPVSMELVNGKETHSIASADMEA
jgi:hypothetical protein